MPKKRRIRAFYPNFFGDNLIAYVALRILMYFNGEEISADVMGICSEPSVRDFKRKAVRIFPSGLADPVRCRVYRDAIPPGPIWAVCRRLFPGDTLARFAEWRFFRSLRPGDLVYLWPTASVRLYERVRAKGYSVVSERINTLVASSQRILDREYAALGLPARGHGLTDAEAEEELRCMALSQAVFSPSPAVSQSIEEAGIPKARILETSYGLRHTEILSPRAFGPPKAEEEVTVLFVGTVCVRKGIHLLLKAWERSSLKARLVIVGRVDPDVKDMLEAAIASNHRIAHHDFMADLKPIYASSDIFALPSLEEGSPLVTYLALGAGLPCIVSPMGGGGVIENGKEGLVIDPHDIDSFAEALRALVSQGDLRQRLSQASAAKAPEYTWDRVALRRLALLKAACPELEGNAH